MAETPPPRKKSSARFIDIAALAQVSPATVNRVLNDRGSVSATTREKVVRAAQQLAVPRLMPEVHRGLTRIDVVLARSQTPFFQRMDLALQRFMQLLDRRIVVHRHSFAPGDDERTADFIRRPPHPRHGLLLAVHDTPVLRAAVQQVSQQGVPVVTLMSDISDVLRLHYAGIDNLHAGRTAGHFMGRLAATKKGTGGRLLVLTNDLHFRAHRDRTAGFLDAVQEKFPALACLPITPCFDDPDQVFQAVDAALKQGDLAGIYHSGAGSAGIHQALQRHGCAGQVVWIGHELSDEHRRWLKLGGMDLVIDQDPDGQVLSGMQHLLFENKWLQQKPPAGPNEFRLFCAENLPSQPYLPRAALLLDK
ncbi:transcriptional regulator, LacI family [Rhodoferax sp. OV413]|uniref:LacI family DNA-binding transcriptional regulator n=1 Tax=Rhodoferax sp. OV413 TaxID=1855285 RepID=UPI00088D0D0C|nr:LacI family DNA-binding transcriptional regulator [Rhodoferax sp. OV413]SDO27620.1 transcriptional regulator, LacI family [Rhodoferax sp. OV413]